MLEEKKRLPRVSDCCGVYHILKMGGIICSKCRKIKFYWESIEYLINSDGNIEPLMDDEKPFNLKEK